MSGNTHNIMGTHGEKHEQSEQSELPAHVEGYRALLLRHNDLASKRKRSSEEEDEKDALAQHIARYVETLSPEQQEDIKTFVLQITQSRVIADEAGKTHELVVRTMHWLPRTMKLAADVIPELCRETVRLALTTVGLTAVGIGQGIRATWRAAMKHLFNQAA